MGKYNFKDIFLTTRVFIIKLFIIRLSQFMQNITSKIQNFGAANLLLVLDIIDFIVDQGNRKIWEEISSKKFLSLLIMILRTKNNPEIQFKILSLFKKWGLKFQNESSPVSNFHEIYRSLTKSGVVFPENYTSSYEKYLKSSKQNSNDFTSDFKGGNDRNFNLEQSFIRNEGDNELDYAGSLKVTLKPTNYEPKYQKLVSFLITIVDNIALSNEIIDNSQPGNVDGILNEIIGELRHASNKLIDTIGSDKLKDEKLMEITLGVTDDINRTTNRFDYIRQGGKPEPFLSYFVEKNAKGDYEIPMNKTKAKKNMNNNNNSNSNSNSRINFDNNNNNSKQNVPEIQKDPNVNNVNDIFDIFSKPVQKNTNQNPIPNSNGGGMQMDFFNISGGNQQPPNFNMNQNLQQQIQPQAIPQNQPQAIPQNQPQAIPQNPTDILQSKLQMIYEQEKQNSMQQMGQIGQMGQMGHSGYPGLQNNQPQMMGMNNDMNNMNNPMQYGGNPLNQNLMMRDAPINPMQFQQQMNPPMDISKNDMMKNQPQMGMGMNMNIPPSQNMEQGAYPNFDNKLFGNDQQMNNAMGYTNNNQPYNYGFQGNSGDNEKLNAIDSLF